MATSKVAADAAPGDVPPSRRNAKDIAQSCSPFVSAPRTEGAIWLKSPYKGYRNVFVWASDSAPRGCVALLHGYGGNALRWQHMGEKYNAVGLKVYAMDQLCHGENIENRGSAGLVGVAFSGFVEDAIALIDRISEDHPDLPFFIHGRSMGGLVAVRTVMRVQDRPKFAGAVFCAPALRINGQGLVPGPCVYNCFFVGLARIVGAVSCGYWPNPAAPTTQLTTDESVKAKCRKDKRMFGDMIRAGFGNVFVAAGTETLGELGELRASFVVLHGTKDRIVPLSASELLMERSGTPSERKKIIRYDGRLHEIMNEPNKEDVMSDIVAWVVGRLDELGRGPL